MLQSDARRADAPACPSQTIVCASRRTSCSKNGGSPATGNVKTWLTTWILGVCEVDAIANETWWVEPKKRISRKQHRRIIFLPPMLLRIRQPLTPLLNLHRCAQRLRSTKVGQLKLTISDSALRDSLSLTPLRKAMFHTRSSSANSHRTLLSTSAPSRSRYERANHSETSLAIRIQQHEAWLPKEKMNRPQSNAKYPINLVNKLQWLGSGSPLTLKQVFQSDVSQSYSGPVNVLALLDWLSIRLSDSNRGQDATNFGFVESVEQIRRLQPLKHSIASFYEALSAYTFCRGKIEACRSSQRSPIDIQRQHEGMKKLRQKVRKCHDAFILEAKIAFGIESKFWGTWKLLRQGMI